ncbi:uncharacterized protein [Haliotis asinina]|uniref:uncharacterized protein n=1 Tax=Haliotis asinina TaxID=109174 RepID=UPI003531FD03
MPRISRANRNIAIGLLQAGQSQHAVACRVGVRQSTISRLWKRWRQQNSVEDRLRRGRPRVTNRAQDRYIRLHLLHHRTATATSTAINIPGLHQVSAQTVKNRLREAGLRARRPYFGLSYVNVIDNVEYSGVPMCRTGFGRRSVRMWGAISYTGKSNLVMFQDNLVAQRYCADILRPHLLPILSRQRELFQQDNARPHTARVTTDFFTNENINVLP